MSISSASSARRARSRAFLQRVGRSGHAVDGTPKGRLFPLSRDELVECAALLDSVRRGELDRLDDPGAAARRAGAADRRRSRGAGMAGGRRSSTLFRRAWPYRELARDGFRRRRAHAGRRLRTRRGRRGALIHHDAVNGVLRGRRGARLTALTSGGTIPDTADYQVMLEPENQVIGTVNEDFAVESLAGDIFQLGNASYRILRVERGTVRVEDAHGQPPTIPVLARRGARPQRRAVGLGVAAARRDRARCLRVRSRPGAAARMRWLAEESRHRRSRRPSSSSSIWPPPLRRSAACRRRTRSCSSASSTKPAACSW